MKQVIVAALALHLVACSSAGAGPAGDGGPGASGGAAGTAGTGATGGSGGGASGGSGGGAGSGTCGPGDQDCICPGGTFECQNNRITCVCPQTCTRSDQCGQDSICYLYDGNCGGGVGGYCLLLARASAWTCDQKPVCGCDGTLYDNLCVAVAARVSPSAAPTSACATQPLRCSDNPSAPSCYPNQYCMAWNTSGSVSESCAHFDVTCAQPSCDCIRYNAQTCACELLPSGIVKLTCTS
jgi:hypothetical protein